MARIDYLVHKDVEGCRRSCRGYGRLEFDRVLTRYPKRSQKLGRAMYLPFEKGISSIRAAERSRDVVKERSLTMSSSRL